MGYVHAIHREACQIAHDHDTFHLGNAIIDGLTSNSTTIRSITLAGKAGLDRTCKGAQHSNPYGTWDNVVVTGSVKITLRTSWARVESESNKVYMPSGSTCKLETGSCIDPERGYTFWNPVPKKIL